jgi:hypothetical protein
MLAHKIPVTVQRIGLYLGGRNSDSLRIKQTVPVAAYFHTKDTFEEGRNYTIALYIPGDLQVKHFIVLPRKRAENKQSWLLNL